MGTNRLTELLEETAAEVPAPAFAATAWATARRVRRRRQLIAGVAAFATVVAVSVPLRTGGNGEPAPVGVTPSAIAVAPGVDAVPADLARQTLAPFPEALTIPADARKLSEHPVERAAVVVQQTDAEGPPDAPLYVLDLAGEWTRIDVTGLEPTRDESGNQAYALRSTALSPDGRRVAVPQPQALVVIDLTTAEAHRIPVPGWNEQVMWWGDETVLVGADGPGVVRVDWRTGTVTPEPAGISAWSSAGARQVSAGALTELVVVEDRRMARGWVLGDPRPAWESPLDESGLPSAYRISRWYGPAVPDGAGRVAAAAWGGRGEMLTVVNARTGAVERILDLGYERMKSCCTALAWVGDHVLLVKTDREGLITWDTRTGVVTQVTVAPIEARLSVRLS
ncbi:hypothetical protein FHR83_002203 [Actinoplanes campanulatus]|uniref:Uncharacterized protein n=1 Tax=Actinoplanes campanulatus TaxID=113559 RepID=A0A7W5AEF6_9ACTN|nr:hypothetical protein [Actinoplanes campanulatus]MBB3094551.1 hypothetical protein [Actinoplanes campanulatus]GGN21886.1 hypothetical protein GCM10010109_36180 [Actinoplanes campanulatus]GID35532.1 hypothetical protein Aca09nite_20380 [Actinoplanes campanulatus]